MTPEKTTKTRSIPLGNSLVIKVPFVDEEIFEKMNTCYDCGREGEIFYNLQWYNPAGVYCVPCAFYKFKKDKKINGNDND